MASAPPPRLTGLDLFRGLAVAGMIIVNTPGSGHYVWWPLDHAAWNGFTPTDLVFPAFLFAVGVALALSFPRRIDAVLWRRVARRTASLIALGWAWQMLAAIASTSGARSRSREAFTSATVPTITSTVCRPPITPSRTAPTSHREGAREPAVPVVPSVDVLRLTTGTPHP